MKRLVIAFLLPCVAQVALAQQGARLDVWVDHRGASVYLGHVDAQCARDNEYNSSPIECIGQGALVGASSSVKADAERLDNIYYWVGVRGAATSYWARLGLCQTVNLGESTGHVLEHGCTGQADPKVENSKLKFTITLLQPTIAGDAHSQLADLNPGLIQPLRFAASPAVAGRSTFACSAGWSRSTHAGPFPCRG